MDHDGATSIADMFRGVLSLGLAQKIWGKPPKFGVLLSWFHIFSYSFGGSSSFCPSLFVSHLNHNFWGIPHCFGQTQVNLYVRQIHAILIVSSQYMPLQPSTNLDPFGTFSALPRLVWLRQVHLHRFFFSVCHHLYSCHNGYTFGVHVFAPIPSSPFLVGENVRGRHICQVSNWWIRKTSRVFNLSTSCLPKVMRIVFPRPKLSWRFLARSAKASDTATTKLTTEKAVVGRPTQDTETKWIPATGRRSAPFEFWLSDWPNCLKHGQPVPIATKSSHVQRGASHDSQPSRPCWWCRREAPATPTSRSVWDWSCLSEHRPSPGLEHVRNICPKACETVQIHITCIHLL